LGTFAVFFNLQQICIGLLMETMQRFCSLLKKLEMTICTHCLMVDGANPVAKDIIYKSSHFAFLICGQINFSLEMFPSPKMFLMWVCMVHSFFIVQVLVGILEPELRVLRFNFFHRLYRCSQKVVEVLMLFNGSIPENLCYFCWCCLWSCFRNFSCFKFCKAGPKMRRE